MVVEIDSPPGNEWLAKRRSQGYPLGLDDYPVVRLSVISLNECRFISHNSRFRLFCNG